MNSPTVHTTASLIKAATALATFGLMATAHADERPVPGAGPRPQDERIALSGGVTLRFERSGSGRPLLLLHTLRTQLEYFDRLVPLLSGYEVFVIDLPGHGQSSTPKVEYAEPLFRRAIVELIEGLGLRDVTLVGESIGGVLAITVAVDAPEAIAHVVAINPYDYGERFGGGIRRSRNAWPIALFSIFGAHTIEPRFLLASVLEGGFVDASRLPSELVDTLDRSGRRDGSRRAECSVYSNWRSWLDARTRYPELTTPRTLVYSSADWSLPQERDADAAALKVPNAIVVPNAGHFVSLEAPEDVAKIINEIGRHKAF